MQTVIFAIKLTVIIVLLKDCVNSSQLSPELLHLAECSRFIMTMSDLLDCGERDQDRERRICRMGKCVGEFCHTLISRSCVPSQCENSYDVRCWPQERPQQWQCACVRGEIPHTPLTLQEIQVGYDLRNMTSAMVIDWSLAGVPCARERVSVRTPANYVTTLESDNGIRGGQAGTPEFCSHGIPASGIEIKVRKYRANKRLLYF